ncbi:hypothetical protein BDN72DRAFT_850617, partial [Pluteus cervinus]
MQSLPPALKIGATERRYTTAPEMNNLPDVLWPRLPYKSGDLRPPVMHYGFIMKTPTVASFFRRFSHRHVQPTIVKFNLDPEVPEWSYIEYIASDIIGHDVHIKPVYLNGFSADALILWNSYNDPKERTMTEDEKKLCLVFGREPAWYLDAVFPTWDR